MYRTQKATTEITTKISGENKDSFWDYLSKVASTAEMLPTINIYLEYSKEVLYLKIFNIKYESSWQKVKTTPKSDNQMNNIVRLKHSPRITKFTNFREN